MEIYMPREDSYLLENEVKKFLQNVKNKSNFKVLDIGSGSGIQALACINSGIIKENVLCTDINKDAIEQLKKQNLLAVHSNLFSKVKKTNKFNLIIFNAPYLPEDKYDKQSDTTAGKKGNEIILKFLKQAKSFLAEGGAILLLFSSLSKPEQILKKAKALDYKTELLAQKAVGMFEKLFVYDFSY